ncbi:MULTISPECIES: ABC transporter permease [unclassified Nocardioides]|uniref:ABC transporter permease n=1 Tax=unclassified Nocardioides TaxID=2615069 RepID=UPI0009F064B3|nr:MULTISPECIES: ABC transporter permease subunit [unclassified Nocardioides]GAW52384.1 Putative glycine betaine ABC transport system in tegral [Nocardioides sp. PD653-B2]GAW53870.1 putative glycine betaine ABC transport system in tegral [Nocardioides sp. PD653]
MSATLAPARPEPDASAPPPRQRASIPRWGWALVVVGVWIVVWAFTKGNHTLAMPIREHTDVQDRLTGFRDAVLASRDTNPVIQLTYGIGEWFGSAVDWCQRMISIEDFPRPVPQIGWLGVTAIATWVGLAAAGWRIAVLVAASFVSFGLFGYWSESMDLLIITFVAVAVAVVIGLPLAVYYGTAGRTGTAVLTTILDLMQTMPTFVYLSPIVLFFGIGASAAVVCTLIYALPPIIRIAGYGIRSVSTTTIEATDSSGQTAFQRLRKVQLPMARSTIVVGVNQTTMAALSMATIAAFVDGPGLGQPVLQGLIRNDVGSAFVPGMLIVVMAVMLDRSTTAASQAAEKAARGQVDLRLRRIVLAVAGAVTLALVYYSRQNMSAARFPDSSWGDRVADWVDSFFTWFTETFHGVTQAIVDSVSTVLLNPLQELLAQSPWWLVGLAILALGAIFGGARAVVPAVVCLAGIRYFGLWHDAMITLNMVLVATLLVMVLAVVFGVWMARSKVADILVRPLLDAGQTIPPFVYLVPVLALFGPSRFTAIVAGVVYAAPVAIKLVADGVKGVSATTLEASRSTGCTRWQEITKVQLPMARGSLMLAANQGLLYVLSMVVIGGLVGAGALGYDVALGTSRSEEWGKGAAAGITIVLLGVLLDRIMRASAEEDAVSKNPLQQAKRFPRFPHALTVP